MSMRKPAHCYKCGQEIFFDDQQRSQRTGKMIPLDKDGESHDCPKSDYQRERSSGNGQRSASITTLDEIDAKLDKILDFVVEINNKLMKQDRLD